MSTGVARRFGGWHSGCHAGLVREISGLVLPVACGGCGTPRTPLCEECARALYGAGARRARPVPEPAGLPLVHAAAPYADAVRALLLAHKERGALGLARPLGVALAGAVRAAAGPHRDGSAAARTRAVGAACGQGARA